MRANDVAIVRMEQFYPFPQKQVDAILEKYKQAKNTLWVQEEPENMGAWSFILRNFKSKVIKLISRRESASPAAGSSKVFAKRQAAVINGVFEYSEVKK